MAAGRDALHFVLQESRLLEYEPLLLEEGADDVDQLKDLDEEEFQQLCLMVGMAAKPFHVKRFQKGLGRTTMQLYAGKRVQVATSAPSVHPPNSILHKPPREVPRLMGAVISPQHVSTSASPRPHIPSSQAAPISVATHQHLHRQKQQLQPQRQQQQQQAHHEPLTSKFACGGSIFSEGDSNSAVNFNQLGSSKQFYLPPFLQAGSDEKDISPLVDELTPIQADLGPCPFAPSDWDKKRTELMRRHAAIYGQNSKRKNEELSLHEENVNEAAFQLCLRDPTLLVRRDELLVLSRKAVKEGGYTFQHGVSRTKALDTTSSAGHKRPLEKPQFDDDSHAGNSYEVSRGGINLPRNMSREKKLKRVEELEFMISKNKTKQSLKLSALEKARQGSDFSTIYHLQAEIESLGSTLANLQEEYSNMKYRLRRSDRYFQLKQKKEIEAVSQAIRPHHMSSAMAPKKARLQSSDGQQFMGDKVRAHNYHHQLPVHLLPPPLSNPQRLSVSEESSTNNADQQSASPAAFSSVQNSSPVGYGSLSSKLPLKEVQTDSVLYSTTMDTSSGTYTTQNTHITSAVTTPQDIAAITTTITIPAGDSVPTPPSASSSSSSLVSSPRSTSPSSPPALFQETATCTTSSSLQDTTTSYLNSNPAVMAKVLPQALENQLQELASSSVQHQDPNSDFLKQSAQSDSALPTVKVLPQARENPEQAQKLEIDMQDDDVTSDQLLANINKLATQAAAKLRSMPHF